MKRKNTQPLYIFNRENPQNSEPQNGPRSGLDYIALKGQEVAIYASIYDLGKQIAWHKVSFRPTVFLGT